MNTAATTVSKQSVLMHTPTARAEGQIQRSERARGGSTGRKQSRQQITLDLTEIVSKQASVGITIANGSNEQTKNSLDKSGGRRREEEVERGLEDDSGSSTSNHRNLAVWPGHTDYSHVQCWDDWNEAEDDNKCPINCPIRFNSMRDMSSVLQSVAAMLLEDMQ